MKMTKKFLVISSCIICVAVMVLMFTLSAACVITTIMSLIFGFWKEAVVAVAVGYIAALGGMGFWDTCSWLRTVCRGLDKE